jgi:excisionase family DNA binding protein
MFATFFRKMPASDQRCHELAQYWPNRLRVISPPTGGNQTINVHIPRIYGIRNAVIPLKCLIKLRPTSNSNRSGEALPKLSEYVKVAEAAEILGVSQRTVRTWTADGKIPMCRNLASGFRLINRKDIK